ncbi:CLUMA_CG020645, isoform A [Clunio marinus]|uniref:CLUMA_CG020645, isoform A n=1 Tax=Clunio marinus TaxID=568069 RepID=A0A1J1J5K6_9DIPT|nr:CLUMA_CG020645, isoform A [Clunio marinus]
MASRQSEMCEEFTGHQQSKKNKKTKFIWKTFWCIIYGCILSFILYNFVYTQLPKNIPHIWILFLTALSCLCAIILCRSSIQFRCVTVLVWLESFGKAGRSGIKALVIMLILSGPIENTISNVREVVRVVECTSFLTYNLTKTKVDLALKPFTNTFSRMDRHLMDVERTFHRITTFIHPLIQEIEQKSHDSIPSDTESFNVKPADFYESIFKKKLKKRCQAQVMEGVHTCEKAFEKAYNNCLEEIPTAIRYAICWPFNIDLICGIENTFISSFVNTCDPSNVIDSSFGVEYMQLKEMGKQFMTHAANISIKYKTNEKPPKVVSSMNETNNKIKKNFDEKANSVYDLMNEIDERRRRAGRSNVLPLRKIDIGKYVDLYSNNSSNYKMCKEFEGYIGLTVEFFLQLIITSFFVLLDQLLYKVLQIIARHSRVNYLQEGVHNLNITKEDSLQVDGAKSERTA